MAKVYNVTAHVEGLECSARVTHERDGNITPGGTWVEDIEVVDEDDGERLDFEELEGDLQEKIQEALVNASHEG